MLKRHFEMRNAKKVHQKLLKIAFWNPKPQTMKSAKTSLWNTKFEKSVSKSVEKCTFETVDPKP